MAQLKIDPNDQFTVDRRTKLIIISFRTMRMSVGVLGLTIGILLPFITGLLGDCRFLQESISHYYYTLAGDVFVGLLCATGLFLIMYPGEGRWEDIWSNLAGLFALLIAFFPTSQTEQDRACVINEHIYSDWVSWIHLSAAFLFFLILGGVSIFQFPHNEPTIRRRNFYRICGVTMWLGLAIMIPMVWNEPYANYLAQRKLVFTIEVIMLTAFGLSWLVKGMHIKSTPQSADHVST